MKMLVAFLACVIGAVVLFAFFPCENYNYICPSIDTRYAAAYSESMFSQVTTGMSIQVVRQKLGEPLYAQTNRNGQLEWYYTMDGKCKWGDFAWLVRAVYFTDGRVSEIVKRVAFD
jgi:outer membrane protein assembly factor BamE (lipoprotein component of BamABCDE complex)